MHRLNLPAGSPIRLTATAGSNVGLHRWEVHVLTGAQAAPLLIFGSDIGDGDCEQGVDIPAQAADCRLEIWARHATAGGWDDDQATITDDTPSRLQISFCDQGAAVARENDVQLSFAFRTGQPATPVKASPYTRTAPPVAAAEPVQNYAEVLAAFEASRRTEDDLLLRKMAQPLEPMNPAIARGG